MSIFGAKSSNSQLFQAGEAQANFNGIPAILLDVNVTIGRTTTPIPTLTDGILWSASQPTGALSSTTILTSTRGKALIDAMTGNGKCKKQSFTLDMSGSCGSGNLKLDIKDAYCTQVSFSVSGGQGYIGSGLQMQFTDCSISA